MHGSDASSEIFLVVGEAAPLQFQMNMLLVKCEAVKRGI